MPWKSDAQRRFGNSPSGIAKMGKSVVSEFNQATKGAALPEKISTKPKMPKLAVKPKGLFKKTIGL